MKNNIYLVLLCLPLFVFSQNPTPVITECSIVDFPFNGDATDVSGNENHGTVYGATLAADRFGNPNSAYLFDGADDYIECVGDDFNLELSDYTISVWFRRDDYGDHFIFSKERRSDNSVNGNRYACGVLSNAVLPVDNNLLYYREAEGLLSPTWNTSSGFEFEYSNIIQLEEWYHLVVVRDSLEMTMYVNGENISQFTFANQIDLTNNLNLRIGARYAMGSGSGATDVFKGAIDDFKISLCALNSEEVEDLYTEESLPVTSITETKIQEEDIYIYPNPACDVLIIENKSDQSLGNMSLYNNIGQEVRNQPSTHEPIQRMGINALPTGIYYLKLGTDYVEKIVIVQPRA